MSALLLPAKLALASMTRGDDRKSGYTASPISVT
jgi:hypothetical protein